MAPPSTLHQSAIPSDFDTPFPPLTRSSTLPEGLQARAQSRRADPLHLAPEDAFHASPPRRPTGGYENSVNGAGADLTSQRQRGRKGSSRSRSRRRKRFQKLLWVNQSCTFVSPLPRCGFDYSLPSLPLSPPPPPRHGRLLLRTLTPPHALSAFHGLG